MFFEFLCFHVTDLKQLKGVLLFNHYLISGIPKTKTKEQKKKAIKK